MNAPLAPKSAAAGSTALGPVLAVSGLVKSFDNCRILNGLDFAVAPGQSTALIRANGSDKSTLLK
jgi:ABC-type branched-subunit amino acid transport system ATPase component